MKVVLNLSKRDNYAFNDDESGVSLSISHPIGEFLEITPAIRRGLQFGTLYIMPEEENKVRVENDLKNNVIIESTKEINETIELTEETNEVIEPVKDVQVEGDVPTVDTKKKQRKSGK